jgi:hypothetical protein
MALYLIHKQNKQRGKQHENTNIQNCRATCEVQHRSKHRNPRKFQETYLERIEDTQSFQRR